MGRRLLFFFGILSISAFAIAGGALLWFFTNSERFAISQSEPAVLSATSSYEELPSVDARILITKGLFGKPQVIECEDAKCVLSTSIIAPDNISDPVFDGDSWYAYSPEGSLVMISDTGEQKQIAAPADLIAPRGVLPNPAGDIAGYWLDNTTEDGEGLTELWVYDKEERSTHIAAEKLYAPDIVTDPNWNQAGTNISFIADSGEGEEEQLEFIVIGTQPPLVRARFQQADIENLKEAATSGHIDISPSGASIAYTEHVGRISDKIHIIRDSGGVETKALSGQVEYIEWLSETALIYAVQRTSQVEFWIWAGASHDLLARHRGVLLDAKATSSKEYINFLSQDGLRKQQLHTLEAGTGLQRTQATLPHTGQRPILLTAEEEGSEAEISPDVTAKFSDAELIAFIEAQAPQMSGDEAPTLTRIITTDKVNTLLVDYHVGEQFKRFLVTVRDIIHPEWTIVARYEATGPDWERVKGGAVATPEPVRVYEWEASVAQWILKQGVESQD